MKPMIKVLGIVFVFLLSILSGYSQNADYPFDIANATFTGQSFSGSAQEPNTGGIATNGNGSSFYLLGTVNKKVSQYDCTQQNNLSTCSFASKQLSVSGQAGVPNNIQWSADGTSIFVLDASTDDVFQYNCSTAYDISTCSYASKSFSATAQATNPFGMGLSGDGTAFFISDRTTNNVYQYNCTVAYDASTCSFASRSFSLAGQMSTGFAFGVRIIPNGSLIMVLDAGNDEIHQYRCTTPNDASTCTYDNRSKIVSAQETNPLGFEFDINGTRLFVVGTIQNAGFGYNITVQDVTAPQIIFDNVTINNVENFNNTFYNISSINLEVNLSTIATNNNTNVTFFLYNSTGSLINTTQFMTNSLNGNLNIVFPFEGTFQFFLNASNNQTNTLSPTSGNFTIHFDKTPPSLSVNLPPEYGFYDNFNFSNFITVSDLNLVSCIVTVSNETTTTCTNTSYSFEFNGNHTINVTATDTAGNINSSLNNIMLINPIQLFNFQLSNGTSITDYIFGGLNFSTTANISTYGSIISIGSNTLLFEKLGFSSTNVTFTVNLTSRINLTTNITQSTIVLRIFNRETLALLTGLTTITLEATTGFNGTTTTGLLNISNINFISEQYQILAEHAGFSPETVFFNYDNQETITLDIFMLNSSSPDAGTITLIVKNTLSQLVESAICSALEWRPAESAFVSVAQGLTNVNGETRLNIELNTKIYKFSCTKQTFTTVTNAQIIQLDGTTLDIILNDILLIPTTLFPNLVTSLTNSSINSTHQLVTYTFADSDGLVTEGCLQSFFVNGNRQTFDQENCVNTPTGSILLTVNINQTSDILMKGILTTPAITDYVTNTLTFKGTGDISFQLARIGLDILIPTMFALLGLGLGVLLLNINIGVILMAVGGWLAVALVPSVMSGATAMFITVIVALMIWGGYVRR